MPETFMRAEKYAVPIERMPDGMHTEHMPDGMDIA